jgi:hypothetical protein
MFFKPLISLLLISLFIGHNTLMSRENLVKENEILKSEIKKLKKEVVYSKTEAVLELSKLNVVYRGISNPIKIAMLGAIKIEANAKGLTKIDDYGNYKLAPGIGQTIAIEIKGTMKNGKVITDTKTLRIHNISRIKTLFQGRDGGRTKLKLTKEDLKKGKLTLKVDDFLYDSPMKVKRFKIKFHKRSTIQVEGNKLNEATKRLVNSLKRGENVQIYDIQMHYEGLRVCKINPVTIQITN